MARQLADRLAAVCGAGAADAIEVGLARARERWPEASFGDDFAGYVEDRARAQPDAATAFVRLRIEDLALAWWASTGEARAIAAFELALAPVLERLLRRFHRLDADELRQLLRVKLFAAERPRIREYSGFGHLENWFKIIASRTFLDHARALGRERIDDIGEDELVAIASPAASPRDAAAKAELAAAVKAALATAIADLGGRERTFLRHVMVDHLTLEQIAGTYRLHRVTVARILSAARQQLYDTTRVQVCERLGIAPSGLASMLQLIDSQIHLSLQRLFPEPTL